MANTKIPSELIDGTLGVAGITSSADGTAITIDSSENVAVTGNLSAAKLTSNNGVLELDDNGSHNGIINVPASISINIDSDNGATTESFSIAKDKTGINDTDVLFRIIESGNVSIGTVNSYNFKTYVESSTKGLFVHAGDGGNTAIGFSGDVTSTDASLTTHDGFIYIGSENSGGTGSNGEVRIAPATGERIRIDADGDLLVNQTSNHTNAKVNIAASNGVPLTIGSDQYGGSGTTTFFTESIEGKTASNTHTVTISFTSQSSRWTSHLVETHFAGSRDNATTVYGGRSVYTFSTLTGFANISDVEDIGTNVSMSANDSGMNLVITISASSVASYQVMVKVISSFGNARPYAISVT